MRSLSFLLSRRWILFGITVVLLAWLAWWLGEWQFHRLDERKERNAIVERNIAADPVPVAEVMRDGVEPGEEWREVTATGEYDTGNTVIVRYRTRDGASGVDVVVPLVTSDGTALLVDRGWMATENSGTTTEDVPAPPAGQVAVTGWVRRDATGDSATVTDKSTRAISSRKISSALDLTTYPGFVELDAEDPAPGQPLEKAELPDLSNGPHFFYGLQWWFFGLLAVGGFLYLAYDEWRGGPGTARRRKADRSAKRAEATARRAAIRAAIAREEAARKVGQRPGQRPGHQSGQQRTPGPTATEESERSQHAAVDGQHDPGDEG
ncbi:SURF1 family protein [Nocardioides guangzhouensis]|uniref:SURF1-like protein n=1 Tax=Nocardioides guangzhouensis TaxID=2497878 RepID=A0A4Q4ZH25_9ACTN|nr:SURF1 family protein [Nocardioides guangzhouensis]RYP87510.1 SURF1 family protein [Nocardioides guangzhouensis]